MQKKEKKKEQYNLTLDDDEVTKIKEKLAKQSAKLSTWVNNKIIEFNKQN